MPGIKKFEPILKVSPLILKPLWAEGINRLLKELSRPMYLSMTSIEQTINKPNFRFILLIHPESDEAIGMTSLIIRPTLMKTTGFVEDVVVDKRYHGLGFGKFLMKYCITLARANNVKYLDLTSNPNNQERKAAIALYEKLGFELIGTVAGSNYYRYTF